MATNDMPSTITSLKIIYPLSPWFSCCYSWTGRFRTLSSPMEDSQTLGHDPKSDSLLISQKLPYYQVNMKNKMGFSIGTDTRMLTRPMWFVTVGCGQKSLRTTGHITWYFHTISYSDLLTCSSSYTEVPPSPPPPLNFFGEKEGF
jgi:hypothetical protein